MTSSISRSLAPDAASFLRKCAAEPSSRLQCTTPRTSKCLITQTTSSFTRLRQNSYKCTCAPPRPLYCQSQPAISSRLISTSSRTQRPANSTHASSSLHAGQPDPLSIGSGGTYYDLFPRSIPLGPPPSGPFAIDLSTLKGEFIALQAQAHPDRHSDPTRAAHAANLSARINEAYNTLRDPLRRAQYLLDLQEKSVAADESVVGQEGEDAEMLMEVMQAREKAEEAEVEEEIARLREENGARMGAVVERLGNAFETGDLNTARREAVKLRYWVGVEERLREGSNMH